MKVYKKLDFALQMGALLVLVYHVINDSTYTGTLFIAIYLIQLVDMAIHKANAWHTTYRSRRSNFSEFLVVYLIVIMLLLLNGSVSDSSLLNMSLPLSFYYTFTCFTETFYPEKRPLEFV